MTNPRREYTAFAQHYDTLGGDRFAARMVPYLMRQLRRRGVTPRRVLDLCCGSGTALTAFAEHGLTGCGVDRSPTMLKLARAKLSAVGMPVYRSTLPLITLPKRELLKPFDLVTAMFDSLNYLPNLGSIGRTLSEARKRVAPGSWLVFDMNLLPVYRDYWDGLHWSREVDNIMTVWRGHYEPRQRRGTIDMALFERRGRSWRRRDERHVQYAYRVGEIRSAVTAAGWRVRHAWECFTTSALSPRSERGVFFCQNPTRNR